MQPLIFVDLDDTLFQTARKCPPGDLTAAAWDKHGEPLSFMAAHQCQFLAGLRAMGQLVPTTGRSIDAFQRVRLELQGYSICSHGSIILTPDGVPEARYHSLVEAAAYDAAEQLHYLSQYALDLGEEYNISIRSRVIQDAGMPLYVSVKHNRESEESELGRLAELIRDAVPEEWTLHVNGNNMGLLPPYASKRRAVLWFLENLAEDYAYTIGVGDSASDLGFMEVCDYALAPTRSQLFSRLIGARA